jgi:hypothetical protein
MTSPVTLASDLLAQPPLDAVFNLQAARVATVVYGLTALLLLGRGLMKPQQRVIVAAMMFGGALTSMIEPFLDVATGAYHPNIGQDTVFSFMGRGIPVWVVICYAIYYGGIGALNLVAFNKGLTRRAVWLWFLVPIFADVLVEEVMLHWDLYHYYGNQPLVLIKFPLYQPAGNSAGVLLGVTALFFLQPYLKQGWRWFAAAAVVMPLAGVMGFCAVCLPGFYAVHSTWPQWAVQLCGIATYGLAGLVVHAVALAVSVNSPWRVASPRAELRPAVA